MTQPKQNLDTVRNQAMAIVGKMPANIINNPIPPKSLKKISESSSQIKPLPVPIDLDALSLEEAHKLIKELQNNQIQLQLQNEALRRSQEASKKAQDNISERKKLEAEQRLLQAAVEFSTDGISISDPNQLDNPIIYASPKMAELTGYSVDELVGNNWRILYAQKPDKHAQVILREALATGREAKVHVRNHHRDGTLYWVEVTLYPLLDSSGKPTHFVSINRDITDQLATEQELKKAKEQAESANLAKSQFLADMSHELRTPLNAILGFTQVLLRNSSLQPEQEHHLEIIHDSGKHLLSLINQVLDMSQIETGHATLTEIKFDLHLLLNRIEEMFELQAQERSLGFHIRQIGQLPRFVYGDDLKLRQILINLLNNGFKFTKKGGVWLTVQASRENERVKLNFIVEDSGVGIDENDMPRVFDPFFQKPMGLQKQEGTGLGLTISREFVHLMEGDIRIRKPEVGEGTIFNFHVYVDAIKPADIGEFEQVQQVIGLEENQPTYRLLVVDDDWANRQALIGLLKSIGFEVEEASNGKEAIDMWQTWQPHLIWMDMRMPVMDGYDATRKIRNSSTGHLPRIVALTAGSLPSEHKWAIESGCDDYLRKPFAEDELFKLIKEQLGVRFIYASHEEIKKPQIFIEHEISKVSLPNEMLTTLRGNLQIGDFDHILEDLQAISEYDAGFGLHLKNLAQNFQYETIQTLLLKVEDNG